MQAQHLSDDTGPSFCPVGHGSLCLSSLKAWGWGYFYVIKCRLFTEPRPGLPSLPCSTSPMRAGSQPFPSSAWAHHLSAPQGMEAPGEAHQDASWEVTFGSVLVLPLTAVTFCVSACSSLKQRVLHWGHVGSSVELPAQCLALVPAVLHDHQPPLAGRRILLGAAQRGLPPTRLHLHSPEDRPENLPGGKLLESQHSGLTAGEEGEPLGQHPALGELSPFLLALLWQTHLPAYPKSEAGLPVWHLLPPTSHPPPQLLLNLWVGHRACPVSP